MKAQLVLQVPVQESPGKALIVAACDDSEVIREFAQRMVDACELSIESADGPFEREFARIRSEQLRARLMFVLDEGIA